MQNCTGTSHDFRLPIRREYTTSTNGAHNSFKLYGKSTTLNFACIGDKNFDFYSDIELWLFLATILLYILDLKGLQFYVIKNSNIFGSSKNR